MGRYIKCDRKGNRRGGDRDACKEWVHGWVYPLTPSYTIEDLHIKLSKHHSHLYYIEKTNLVRTWLSPTWPDIFSQRKSKLKRPAPPNMEHLPMIIFVQILKTRVLVISMLDGHICVECFVLYSSGDNRLNLAIHRSTSVTSSYMDMATTTSTNQPANEQHMQVVTPHWSSATNDTFHGNNIALQRSHL